VFVNDDHVRLGDLLDAVGQRLHWIYDLGVRWEHTIEVVDIASDQQSEKATHVFCVDGTGACPPEDGNGCDSMYARLMHTGWKIVNGKKLFETDSLWVDESGNDVYKRSIAAN
jgi:hypothetical protein